MMIQLKPCETLTHPPPNLLLSSPVIGEEVSVINQYETYSGI